MDDLMKQATDALYEKMFAKAQREVGDAVILLSIQAYLREHPEHVRRFPEPSYVPNELYDQAYNHILGVDPIVRDKVLKFHAGFSSTFILPLEALEAQLTEELKEYEDEAKEAPVPMKIETGSLQPRDTPKPPRKQKEPSILDKLYDGCPVSDPTSPISFFD